MKNENEFKLIVDSRSINESFARVVVSAFITPLDPTLEELADLKTRCRRPLQTALYMDIKTGSERFTYREKLSMTRLKSQCATRAAALRTLKKP